jgi:hypothetical protein
VEREEIMKSKKHIKLDNDFESMKRKKLEYIATKMLKNDDDMQKLKEKKTDIKWLKLF